MKGQGVLDFYEIGEEYELTFPALYVRGLLIGVMRMEIAGAYASVYQRTHFLSLYMRMLENTFSMPVSCVCAWRSLVRMRLCV